MTWPRADGFAEEFGMLSGVFTDDEEGGVGIVTLEEIEEFRRHRGIRTVVEGDGELAGGICMGDCGTENF